MKFLKLLLTALCFVRCCFCWKDIDFTVWNEVLQQHTAMGIRENISINVVDYSGIAKDFQFQQFIDQLATVDSSNLTLDEFYALFMNGKNIFIFFGEFINIL